MSGKGAQIERGAVTAVTEDGYTVASCDRDGLTTPPIESADGETYAVGETVCFFLFADGTGKIICRL